MEQGETHIVYQIQGDDEVVLYVGITGRKSRRLQREHFTPKGHVDAACYRDATAIFYHECISREDASFREAYLIKTLNPRFNEKLNKPGAFSFSISFDWQYLPVDKSRLDTPPSPRRRRKNVGFDIPTFDEARLSLGIQLSFDCCPARIEGPAPDLTWLNGDELSRIVDAAWVKSGASGPLRVGGATSFVCKILSDQDWVCHIEYLGGADADYEQVTAHCVTTRGELGSRVSWLSGRGEAEVWHELSRSAQSWHRESGPRRLVGTLATELGLTVRVYDWRDEYFLSLVYLSEMLQAGAVIEDRFLVLTHDLQRGLLHDWFVHQSRAAGYSTWISGVEVQPDQKEPTSVWDSQRRRIEAECLWLAEVFSAGRSLARHLNQTVWVYSLAEVRDLQLALEAELKRLLDGATDVWYHDEPFAFQNYYDRSPLAGLSSPKPVAQN